MLWLNIHYVHVYMFCNFVKYLNWVYIAGGKRGKKVWEVLTMMVTGQTSHITFVTFLICSWIAHVTGGEFVVIINYFIMQFGKYHCLCRCQMPIWIWITLTIFFYVWFDHFEFYLIKFVFLWNMPFYVSLWVLF